MRGLWFIMLLALCIGCIEPYVPDIISEQLNLLVVDGSISSDGNASVTLSRSVDMNTSPLSIPVEEGATVEIGSSSGKTFQLQEEPAGTYRASDLDLDADEKFTLSIKTSDGKEYHSDEVVMYETPEIDSVYWVVGASGNTIEIRVNSKDKNLDSTGFYLWDCIETYEYTAAIYSKYKFVNKKAIERLLPEEDVYTCWLDELLPSSTFDTHILTEPTIAGVPVQVVKQFSKKISVRYSILVRQRIISEEEYSFRSRLKTTTDNTGSIFAVTPASVVGNIHSVDNPDKFVLGYFRAQDVKTRRFFMDKDELPAKFKLQEVAPCRTEESCHFDQPPMGPSTCVDVAILSDASPITGVLTNSKNEEVAYIFTTPQCGDCRAWGGTTTKPPFW
jgi:hypothetical protein